MKEGNPVTCAYSKFPCERESLKSSKDGYCILHAKAEDKNEREFKKALKKYMEEGNYDFSGFVFVGDINFKKDFGVAVFKKADFGEASFQGGAYFEGASFQEWAYFGGASFQEWAYFGGASFQGGADFEGAEFRTRAFMSPECMRGDVSLVDAILENISLTPLNLDKSAQIDFTGARARNTDIRREDIEGHIEQEREKDFSKAKEIYLLLKNNFHSLGRYDDESWAFRKEKEMERKSFWHFRRQHKERELGQKWKNKGIKDCFYPALLNFEYTAKYLEDHWLPPSCKKIKRVISYMANFPKYPIANIKDEFKNFVSFVALNRKKKMGNVSRKEVIKALWFYIKYPMKYSWSTFLKYLYGWGERPWLILLWCLVTIFIFSGLYIRGNIVARDGSLVKSYLDKLYFSGVTFTTLGYGDFSPIGGTRLLAFFESFLGVFFIALFVFSFARRTAGR